MIVAAASQQGAIGTRSCHFDSRNGNFQWRTDTGKGGVEGGGVLGLGNKIYHGNCVAQHPRVRTVTSIMIILWMAERTGGVKARLAGESPPRS